MRLRTIPDLESFGGFMNLEELDNCEVVLDVVAELKSATEKFGAFNSTHEGAAILLEEYEELWDLVKTNPKKFEGGQEALKKAMRAEAIQVAAMAMRFVIDVCGE